MEVKIYLEPGECEDEAKEQLVKAFQSHVLGENHTEDFQEPAARYVASKMVLEHEKMFTKMIREIIELLESGVR